MIRSAKAPVLVMYAGVVVIAMACAPSSTDAPTSSPTGSQVPPSPSQDPADAGLVIDITIAAGTVTPTNAALTATVGKPITMRVSSDAADELHVHSVPEHTFAVQAQPDQSFQFTVDVPGRVDIEVHHLDRTVATVQVRP
jgi:hypothetical protein